MFYIYVIGANTEQYIQFQGKQSSVIDTSKKIYQNDKKYGFRSIETQFRISSRVQFRL